MLADENKLSMKSPKHDPKAKSSNRTCWIVGGIVVLALIGVGIAVGVVFGLKSKAASNIVTGSVVVEVSGSVAAFQANQLSFLNDIAFNANLDSKDVSVVSTQDYNGQSILVTVSVSAGDQGSLNAALASINTSNLSEDSVIAVFADMAAVPAPTTTQPPVSDPVTTAAPVTTATPVTTAAPGTTIAAPVTTAPAVSTGPLLTTPIRVDCGSLVSVTDNAGISWSADSSFTGGIAYTSKIVGLVASSELLTERYFQNLVPNEGYHFNVAPGTYKVTLSFAEISTAQSAVGARTFLCSVGGTPINNGLPIDIFAQTKATGKVLQISQTVTITSGTLDVTFTKMKQNPIINAIEIVSA